MKPKFRSLAAAFSPSTRGALIICASLSTSASLHAASQTWDGDTDANWATVTNWVSNTGAPGVVAPAAAGLSADTATFNAALVGGTRGGATDPITYENSRQVRHIAFNTAPGPFVFGVSGGNQLWLGHTGSVTMSADVASPQTFASSVAIRLPSSTNGTYTVTNNASSSSATLSFSTIASGSATSRPISFSLGGSNTGENTVGAFTDSGALRITKSGVGTWVVTGASVINAQTDVGVVGGWEINGGTLAAANNSALGSLGTANSLGVTINDTGTLEIRNGITLDNGLSLNLNNGGTIKAVGTSGTNGRINVGTAAATSVTINTNASGDVFTIGNGTNDLTGGAADSVINIGGPGTVIQNVASNYAGKWMLNSGTLQLGSPTALGATVSTGVGFGASSTAILETLGKSPTITSLNSNATPGTPVIRNGDATLAATLTVNNTTSDTYAGTITDGSTGTLGLTKGGTGTLTLSGTNTYTGDTVVNNGTLKINSAASTPVVTVDSGGTLGGTGSISGAVTVKNLGRLAPGNSVGTLTAGSLTIESGAILDYEFGTGNDLAVSTTSGGLTLNGGGINLYQDATSSNTPARSTAPSTTSRC
jgi:autotransporter-associated beta strand protein